MSWGQEINDIVLRLLTLSKVSFSEKIGFKFKSRKLYLISLDILVEEHKFKFYEICLSQENTTGWLSETIPRDLDEKTFIQVRFFCLSSRLNSTQLNPTIEEPRVRFHIELCLYSSLTWNTCDFLEFALLLCVTFFVLKSKSFRNIKEDYDSKTIDVCENLLVCKSCCLFPMYPRHG